jgi:hypothetical protein
MWTLFAESTIIGFITWVIGTIIFNLSINKTNKDKNKPYGIDFAFFTTGLILHLLLEIGGFNKWFCDKKIITGYHNISKLS